MMKLEIQCAASNTYKYVSKYAIGFLPSSRKRNVTIVIVMLASLMLSSLAMAQETADYFRQNCISCHTIGGGRLTGPDLKDVSQRRDRDWLINFIRNPQAVIDSGDQYAAKLLEDARGVVMPPVASMTKDRAGKLVDLIETESLLEKSQFVGLQISNEPFTDADVATGRELFLGNKKLANGGPPCISCHDIYDLTALGGGMLGPDLTRVYERLEGRKTLSAWLSAPATQTMLPVFKKRAIESGEIHALVAYFESAAQHGEQDHAANRLTFLLLGLGGSLLMLTLFDVIWKQRYREVRRPLVAGAKIVRGDK